MVGAGPSHRVERLKERPGEHHFWIQVIKLHWIFSQCQMSEPALRHETTFLEFVDCQPSEIAAACLLFPMKLLRTLAAVPLFGVGLWAADSVDHGITTP